MKAHPLSYAKVVTCRTVHSSLQPFVLNYSFRRMVIPPGCHLKKVMPLRSESSIDFFLGDAFETVDLLTGSTVPFWRCTIRGPRTCTLYSILLKGEFISFTIKFKPTGLYRLLGIRMDRFTNKAIPGIDMDQLPFGEMTRQILYPQDMEACIQVIEPYLLFLAESSSPVPPSIEKAVQIIGRHKIIGGHHKMHSISGLANDSNLSERQLHRHFIKYTGVCPKTYFRMHRFLKLLSAKRDSPEMKWTTLAHEFGFYDQMHLVKEFKQFLKITPSAFKHSDFAF